MSTETCTECGREIPLVYDWCICMLPNNGIPDPVKEAYQMSKEEDSYREICTVPLHEITDTSLFLSYHLANGKVDGVKFDVTAGGEGLIVSFENGEGQLGDRYLVKLEDVVVTAVEQMKEKRGL